MTDRYLFRGKRKDNGDDYKRDDLWEIGYLVCFPKISRDPPREMQTWIYDKCNTNRGRQVDPATVGRCCGLSAEKSYRGTEPEDLLIFEGDIVKVFYFGLAGSEYCGCWETEEELAGVIEYGELGLFVRKIVDKKGNWREFTGCKNGEGEVLFAYLHDIYDEGRQDCQIEIIGNIHDNPGLLEGV